MSDTKLTLEDRSKFESLVELHAMAAVKVVRAQDALMEAKGAAHRAMHAILDYVNERTAQADGGAFRAVAPALNVPTGTQEPTPLPPWSSSMFAIPGNVKAKHDKTQVSVPILGCACATCCEARALASIGQPAEGLPFAAVQTGGVAQNSGN